VTDSALASSRRAPLRDVVQPSSPCQKNAGPGDSTALNATFAIADRSFIDVFDVSASSENAQKNSLLTNGLPATRRKDPDSEPRASCGKVAPPHFSQNQQYAAHSARTEKILATRQRVALGAAQQKRNTCAPITSLSARA
jgi:hypothetical protein